MKTIFIILLVALTFTWNFLEGIAGAGPPSADPFFKKVLFFIGAVLYLGLGFYLIILSAAPQPKSIWGPLLTIGSFSVWALVGIMLNIIYIARFKK